MVVGTAQGIFEPCEVVSLVLEARCVELYGSFPDIGENIGVVIDSGDNYMSLGVCPDTDLQIAISLGKTGESNPLLDFAAREELSFLLAYRRNRTLEDFYLTFSTLTLAAARRVDESVVGVCQNRMKAHPRDTRNPQVLVSVMNCNCAALGYLLGHFAP